MGGQTVSIIMSMMDSQSLDTGAHDAMETAFPG
jgi:hypothetical protein